MIPSAFNYYMKTLISRVAGRLAAFIVGAAALTAPLCAQSTYGLSFFGNELFSVDATGMGTLVGAVDANVTGYGLAFRGDHLFTFDPNVDRIREINPTTARVMGDFNIGVGDLLGEGDLAFRSDGMGFLSTALAPDFTPTNDLFRFDIAAGTSVRIGSTSVTLDGLAFVGNILFGLGQEGDASLYIVDQNTAALTPVGMLGLMSGSPFAALASGPTGLLYGAVNDRLYSIDATTGLATEISASVLDFGFSSVSGLAIAPLAAVGAVPEPSTYGLIGGAFLMLGIFLRRIRKSKQD